MRSLLLNKQVEGAADAVEGNVAGTAAVPHEPEASGYQRWSVRKYGISGSKGSSMLITLSTKNTCSRDAHLGRLSCKHAI